MSLNTYALTANFLHRSYRGELLSEDQKDQVDHYLINMLDNDARTSLQQFITNSGLFEDLKEKIVKESVEIRAGKKLGMDKVIFQ